MREADHYYYYDIYIFVFGIWDYYHSVGQSPKNLLCFIATATRSFIVYCRYPPHTGFLSFCGMAKVPWDKERTLGLKLREMTVLDKDMGTMHYYEIET